LNNTTKLAKDLAKLAITTSLSRFVASIQGAIQGTIAFQDAILEGAGANAAAAAQVSAQMNALADSLESTGTNMISLGAESAKTAVSMILLGLTCRCIDWHNNFISRCCCSI
jgi:methyl-accepting chemotaxis protein